MSTLRTFIAIEPPPEARETLDTLLRTCRGSSADVRWESGEKLHATVKFLGDVEESRITEVVAALENSLDRGRAVNVVIERCGTFPDRKHPKVVWVGCTDGDGLLGVIKRRLDSALRPLGCVPDDRPFRPHITLGRVKSRRGIEDLLSLLENLTFEPISASINRIVLLKSVLRPQGAEYSLLHAISLPLS